MGKSSLSIYGKWPWAEFAHGATGILEAYAFLTGDAKRRNALVSSRRITIGLESNQSCWKRANSTPTYNVSVEVDKS